MPPKPLPTPQQPPPAFSIKVSNGLYLDNKNRFLTAPLAAKPVYELGGGVLSLSSTAASGLSSGILAVLPLKGEEGWKTTLRDKLGVDESKIALAGKIADIASNVVMIVGWAQAAFKIAEAIGILKAGKTVAQLAQEILDKLNVVQDMTAEANGADVKRVLETAISEIEHTTDRSLDLFNTLPHKNKDQRTAIRIDLLNTKAVAIGVRVEEILQGSRWELFNQANLYKHSWGDVPDYENKNPPFWRAGLWRNKYRKLADDGKTWIQADYPAPYKLRFDYRAAMPFAMHGITSYITALTMAEPEFRSTVQGRSALEGYVKHLEGILTKMRAVFVRSFYEASDFDYIAFDDVIVDGVVGDNPDFFALLNAKPEQLALKPLFYWKVGALDLCAHTDSHFDQLADQLAKKSPAPPPLDRYKLGTLNFDWQPPAPELAFDPGNAVDGPHWRITNGQACADAANRQSEEDFAILVQSSGYVQLAQLHAMLRHLITDPDQSETVSVLGTPKYHRRRSESRSVEVNGYRGLGCRPEDLAAVGTLQEYSCKTAVSLELQRSDRVNQIATRILVAALLRPVDEDFAPVLSEAELTDGMSKSRVALPTASTFDWYISSDDFMDAAPSNSLLAQMASKKRVAVSHQPAGAAPLAMAARVVDWIDVQGRDYTDVVLADAEIRNVSQDPIELSCSLVLTTTNEGRSAVVEVASVPGSRNIRHLYVVVEEELYSGHPLRTYIEVPMNTQVTYLPASFFQREEACRRRTAEVIDYIDRHYTESTPRLPLGVPVSERVIEQHVRTLKTSFPEVVSIAIEASE